MIYGVYLKIYLHVCIDFSMYVQYVLRCINNLEVDLHVLEPRERTYVSVTELREQNKDQYAYPYLETISRLINKLYNPNQSLIHCVLQLTDFKPWV